MLPIQTLVFISLIAGLLAKEIAKVLMAHLQAVESRPRCVFFTYLNVAKFSFWGGYFGMFYAL